MAPEAIRRRGEDQAFDEKVTNEWTDLFKQWILILIIQLKIISTRYIEKKYPYDCFVVSSIQ